MQRQEIRDENENTGKIDLGVGHTEKNQQIMYFCPHTLCQHIVSFSHYFLPALGSWAKLLGLSQYQKI